MKKNRRIICFIVFFVLITVASVALINKNNKVIVWGVEKNLPGDFQRHWDKLISDLHLDIDVRFVQIDYSYYFSNQELPAFNNYDIVTLPADFANTWNYAKLSREGALADWSERLEEKNYYEDIIPREYWDSLKIEGKVYGVLDPSVTLKRYVAYNKELLAEHEITIKVNSQNTFLELLQLIAKKEEDNIDFYALEAFNLLQVPGAEYLNASCGILVTEEEGVLTAGLSIDNAEYMMCLEQLNRAYKDGLIGFNSEAYRNGNFFSTFLYEWSEDDVREKLQTRTNGDYVVERITDWDNLYRGIGTRTVVLKHSKKVEKAMDVICAIIEHSELSQLFINAGLGKHIGSVEEREGIFEEVAISNLNGFYLDDTKIREEWNRLVECYSQHSNFYCGISENFYAEKLQIQQELNAIGIDKILNEVNHQLELFQLRQ